MPADIKSAERYPSCQNNELREASGHVSSNQALVSFLYELMRDHVPPGVVETILHHSPKDTETVFTNGYLAKYAVYVAEKLK